MKIYTKTGDDGETGLFAGPRVSKDDPRIEAYGTVDELNAMLGAARTEPLPASIDALLERIQSDLFCVGAELATPDPAARGTQWIGPSQITALEQAIDNFEDQLEPLRQFILPGGSKGAAALHVCRGVCRRAERRIVTLGHMLHNQSTVPPLSNWIVQYVNRLSDLLFVLARAANVAVGSRDIIWQKPSPPAP